MGLKPVVRMIGIVHKQHAPLAMWEGHTFGLVVCRAARV
jgi:hypothetical protein